MARLWFVHFVVYPTSLRSCFLLRLRPLRHELALVGLLLLAPSVVAFPGSGLKVVSACRLVLEGLLVRSAVPATVAAVAVAAFDGPASVAVAAGSNGSSSSSTIRPSESTNTAAPSRFRRSSRPRLWQYQKTNSRT